MKLKNIPKPKTRWQQFRQIVIVLMYEYRIDWAGAKRLARSILRGSNNGKQETRTRSPKS